MNFTPIINQIFQFENLLKWVLKVFGRRLGIVLQRAVNFVVLLWL